MPITPNPKIEDSETHHYVSNRKQRGNPEKPPQPPLTPMIDVTFQLLLYFLLTSKFRKDEGQIPGSLPQAAAMQEQDTPPLRPIRIVLQPVGNQWEHVKYIVDNRTPIDDERELHSLLIERKKHVTEDQPVVIKSDGNVRWKYVVEVFNSAVRAKFKKIGFDRDG